MRKIASYLRRFFLPVLGIVALLVIQAVCDLSLPDYTSKIVNVGIQQGGIENPAPEQIRQSEMEKLLLLVPEESRDAVLEKYTLNTEKDPAVYEQKSRFSWFICWKAGRWKGCPAKLRLKSSKAWRPRESRWIRLWMN